jgi:hypothetical protein
MNERLKELAVQAGLPKYMTRELCPTVIERFAELVRADEREACAMECIKLANSWARLGAWGTKTDFHECTAAIRARGET